MTWSYASKERYSELMCSGVNERQTEIIIKYLALIRERLTEPKFPWRTGKQKGGAHQQHLLVKISSGDPALQAR